MYDQPTSETSPETRPATNVMGVVGFILAFCVSPIGLLVSLAALAKPPRGLAIGGVIVGLIGSVVWGLLIAGGYYMWPLFLKGGELVMDTQAVQSAVASYQSAHNNELPPDLATAGVPSSAQTDPWGNPYVFAPSPDNKSWTLTTTGYDGQLGTFDDGVFTSSMTDTEKQQEVGEVFRRHFESKYAKPGATKPAGKKPAAPAGSATP